MSDERTKEKVEQPNFREDPEHQTDETFQINTTTEQRQQIQQNQSADLDNVLSKQLETVKEEAERFDHKEIDEGNGEYIDQVKVMRKRHRKNNEFDEMSRDSDVDDQFKIGLVEAASKFGQKRKKKHLFTEIAGEMIPIEPFNIKSDIREGLLTEEGYLKKSLQRHDNQEQVRDPWLDSIREDQENMLKKEQQKQLDSDRSESEDDGANENEEKVSNERSMPLQKEQQEEQDEELRMFGLREQLIQILLPNETATKAMKRLKPESKVQRKRKNIRKSELAKMAQEQAGNGIDETQAKQFELLVSLIAELQAQGATTNVDIHNEKREDLQFELDQDKLLRQRQDNARNKDKK